MFRDDRGIQKSGALFASYPAIAAFVLGFFAYVRAPSRLKAAFFFCFSLAFAAWLLGDVVVWTANSYHLVAALWAPLDLLEITFFLLLFGFVYVDLFPKKLPQWFNPALLIAAGIPFILTVLGKSVYELNQPVCEMLNNRFLEDYKLLLEIVVLSGTLILGLMRIVAVHGDRTERIRIALVTLSVFLFMGIFGGSEYYANTTYVYEVHLYALFTLPIFILLLTIAITSYSTFRLGDAAVKTLFYVFLVLAGTQFFFVQDMTGFLLAAMSFGVVLTLGVMLFRLSEREIAQRHLIEKQEQELEVVNKQQENLLHFISHEIKGYLTKSEAGFAEYSRGRLRDHIRTTDGDGKRRASRCTQRCAYGHGNTRCFKSEEGDGRLQNAVIRLAGRRRGYGGAPEAYSRAKTHRHQNDDRHKGRLRTERRRGENPSARAAKSHR